MDNITRLSDISIQIFQTNGALLQWGDQLCADLNLTSARWQMLGALALAGEPQTAPQLGERMGISRQGVQKQLNLLVADGLIQTLENPAHKRSVLYQFTPQGEQIYHTIHQRCQAKFSQWLDDLNEAELVATQKVLGHLLQQVRANVA